MGTFANATPQNSRTLPGAMIVSVLGVITIGLIRQSGHTSADVALVMLSYRRVAGGVLFIGLMGGTSAQLDSYLFGSITIVIWDDILIISTLSVLILLVGVGIAPALSSVTNDEGFVRSTGLPVRGLSVAITVLSALTVVTAVRVVSSPPVSTLMAIPVAIAQLNTRFFIATMVCPMVYDTLICAAGLSFTYFADLSPGASIVVLTIGIYALGSAVRTIIDAKQRTIRIRRVRASVEHPELAHHNEPAGRV